ncbi:hypothetical protein ACMHYO_07095 [Allopusillimonas ginsengisoli]|uniref:hypothetical protein n=1 Tax=Allopusillimonas ginsengisoli TaxID=453575 RepID=UPI0039C0D708
MKEVARSKVYYRPIEAAIRWAGLLRHQQEILFAMSSPRNLPRTLDYPRWGELLLCMDRIYDAVINRELPYGKNGVTLNDESLLDSTELTIRHIDLKRWVRTHYPELRPGFLFSRSERIVHPIITLEAGHAMLVEREALKAQLDQRRRQLLALQALYEGLLKQAEAIPACTNGPISDRAETTYLNIIGGMLTLMLGTSPSGKAYSSFRTQEAVVSALVAHHHSVMGITERTLNGKFASARRRLRSANT